MSAPREDAVYLGHIRDAISRIGSYLEGVSEEQFVNTPLLQDGVIRQLEIIGEATKRLSQRLRQSTPQVPWKDVAGMRDKLAHDYMGVDLQAVWDSATIDVPALGDALEHLPDPSTGSNSA